MLGKVADDLRRVGSGQRHQPRKVHLRLKADRGNGEKDVEKAGYRFQMGGNECRVSSAKPREKGAPSIYPQEKKEGQRSAREDMTWSCNGGWGQKEDSRVTNIHRRLAFTGHQGKEAEGGIRPTEEGRRLGLDRHREAGETGTALGWVGGGGCGGGGGGEGDSLPQDRKRGKNDLYRLRGKGGGELGIKRRK